MGLLHTATTSNRVIDSGLSITYSRKLIYGKWHYHNEAAPGAPYIEGDFYKAWEYKRFAKKTYRYVGLDYDSACTIADTLRDSYTRTYRISRVAVSITPEFERISGGDKCMTQVSVNKVAGHIYEIVISVNEEDVAYTTESDLTTPQVMFAVEDTRTYDY